LRVAQSATNVIDVRATVSASADTLRREPRSHVAYACQRWLVPRPLRRGSSEPYESGHGRSLGRTACAASNSSSSPLIEEGGRGLVSGRARVQPCGGLATVPDLVGITRFRVENRVPPVDAPIVVEIWLHLQGAETFESPRLAVRVEPRHGGLRAVPLR
jgi:hypothetical protein